MFDARDLLGRLLQSGLSGSTNERLGNAMGPSGLGQGGNPLSDILSQLSGLAGASQGSATQVAQRKVVLVKVALVKVAPDRAVLAKAG